MFSCFLFIELCIDKVSCTSHHTGRLCVLHASLFENGVLHLQTEKVKKKMSQFLFYTLKKNHV